MDFISKEPRLRALSRLLEYALVESEELALAVPAKLLGAAALAVREELENLEAPPPERDASRQRPPSKQ